MVRLDFYPGPDFAVRHPKQTRLRKRAPDRPGLPFPARPHPHNHPGARRSVPISAAGQYWGVREQSWAETPRWHYRIR
jgi:hypothetical protein